MKKILLLLAILISLPAFSQSADERIGRLLNESDWFGLEKIYPTVKDSMQVDFLKLMSEIMIDYNFNRLNAATTGINKLLADHQHEIGGSNALNMAILACQIEGLKGHYATAAQNAQSIINQLKAQGAERETYKGAEQILNFYEKTEECSGPRYHTTER